MNTQQSQPHPYWGFWATLGFGLVIFVAFVVIQTLALVFYALAVNDWSPATLTPSLLNALAYNGDAVSFAEFPSALASIGLILLFIYLRKTLGIRDYLQLHPPRLIVLIKWLGIMALAIVALEIISNIYQRDTPKFMFDVYSSSDNMMMLWIALVLIAPVFEEFFFRGFLLEGLRHSFVGTAGAIVLTSAGWAALHIQYQSFEIIAIFLLGILFAIARLKTKSLYIPIAMHMMMNLLASVMMAVMTENAQLSLPH